MKKISLIALLTAVMVMISSAVCFAEGGLELLSSYPEEGQKNTSMENLGVKLTFNNPVKSGGGNDSKFSMVDEDGEKVPVQILFSEKDDGLVLVIADIDKGFVAKNNAEYTLTIDAGLTDTAGNTLAEPKTVSFKTYNQKINTGISMMMMFVMMGGLMFMTMKQQNAQKEEDSTDDSKDAAFNPYKEAKRTGKSVEEIKAAQAKKEAKEAKKKARKNAKADDEKPEKKIDKCADYLNNVYHVHAPAPKNKADRSIEAIKAANKKSTSKAKKK